MRRRIPKLPALRPDSLTGSGTRNALSSEPMNLMINGQWLMEAVVHERWQNVFQDPHSYYVGGVLRCTVTGCSADDIVLVHDLDRGTTGYRILKAQPHSVSGKVDYRSIHRLSAARARKGSEYSNRHTLVDLEPRLLPALHLQITSTRLRKIIRMRRDSFQMADLHVSHCQEKKQFS
jgi:hypothetical protein